MRIKPLGDHVVLKNVEVEVTTASGLILAGAAGKEKPQFAEIVEVGPGGMIDGKEVKMEVPSARRSSIRSTPAPRSRSRSRSTPSSARATSSPSWRTKNRTQADFHLNISEVGYYGKAAAVW